MKHTRWLGLAAAMLVVATLACGGGGGEEPTQTPTRPPSETELPPSVGLDVTLAPNYGSVELESGFTPDPYEVAVISGGGVDVDEFDLGDGCTGWATNAPDFRLFWSGDPSRLRIFFVPDEPGEDTTLIINDPAGNWLCEDDYSGWNPLVEIDEADPGQYDVWVGSFGSSGRLIPGTLYITELDLGPDDFTVEGTEVRQWAVAALASSEWSSPEYSAQQATGAPDTDECGDIETAWASESAAGVDWLELHYAIPVRPIAVNIYETHSPGFIVGLEVIDTSGDYHTVWEADPTPASACPRVFTILIDGVDFAVSGVRIHLDQSDGGNWDEIDAVELVGTLVE